MPGPVRRSPDATSASLPPTADCPRCTAPDLELDPGRRLPGHNRPGTRKRCDGSRLQLDDLL